MFRIGDKIIYRDSPKPYIIYTIIDMSSCGDVLKCSYNEDKIKLFYRREIAKMYRTKTKRKQI